MPSIDFERSCTSASSNGCWLRNELASWNEVLNCYGLNLSEVELGKLALSTFDYCHGVQRRLFFRHEHYSPSFFIAWLPRKHHCIRAMRLRSEVLRWPLPLFASAAALIDSAGHSSNLRKLEVSGAEHAQEACEAMRASADSLEDVSLSNCGNSANVMEVLADLVKNGAQRLKKLSIRIYFENDNGMLDALLRCADLTELTLQFNPRYSVPWTMSELLAQCNKLEKLSFDSRHFSRGSFYSLHAALAANTSLTHLHVVVDSVATCLAVCEAVGYSSSLKMLQLSYVRSPQVCGEEPVALLLANNTGLKTLIVGYFVFCEDHSRSVAEGLARNSVLELFDIKNSTVDEGALSLLTGSLEINTTLKKMMIGKSSAPRGRDDLLRVLSAGGGRIDISPWTDAVVSTLAPSLGMQAARPQELSLDVSSRLSDEALRCLRAALREARSVRKLTLHVTDSIGPALGDAVAYLLEDNHFITTVKLKWDIRSNPVLQLNIGGRPSPAHFWLNSSFRATPRGRWHSNTLGKAGSAARTRVGALDCRCEGVCSVALALTDSPTVTSFEAGNICLDFPGFDVCKTITRNLGLLNDATRFVTRADVSKRCALAFETLATAPSFREHLSKVTGKSETECELAVRAAAGFLADNFFVITGVVQRSVSCHPGESTQLDALNGVGLRVITRHLRASDVKD
ncbi:hypothetical protein HPB48_022996 [Haemaphysalis longicornis]|uniref:Ran gtpase-activating protein n=1 Tax=Haemaphysalis longicornis TaxID=44386 RepID=A0A9J6FVK3_HAELO|nr:hypothetical protein HPB48_022996 [Haemaphysalis longicornis]